MKHYTQKRGAFITFIIIFFILLMGLHGHAQTRCKAIKKDGTQCKMMIVEANGYCRFHQAAKYQGKDIVKANLYQVRINKDETFTLLDGNREVQTFKDEALDKIILNDNQ